MKLSLRSEYALLSLIHLARSSEALAPAEIAETQHIPAEALAEILLVLNSTGYTKKNTANGWVRLVRSADRISVAKIIRLFDGVLAPLEPVSAKGYAPAPMDQEQKLSGLFDQIQDQISKRLEDTSIAELV